jgi:hypothetical protein
LGVGGLGFGVWGLGVGVWGISLSLRGGASADGGRVEGGADAREGEAARFEGFPIEQASKLLLLLLLRSVAADGHLHLRDALEVILTQLATGHSAATRD